EYIILFILQRNRYKHCFSYTSVFDHSSFPKEENGVTIVYYCLVHSFAVFRNLMMEENNKLKNITMTIMLFL
ncbi:hypothetical protein, partial [Bacteroides thetaiotaomicron]|uniref:hypothetical protein n=1 Tax=Bacteroides thetaiotaomicron TaxID=818 RepID=UPI0039C1D1DB